MNSIIYQGRAYEVPFAVADGRELGMWWEPGDGWTREREEPIRYGVIHHQGGEGKARQLYNVLEGRDLSVHFEVDQDGVITQMADLHTVCAHAGDANGASWGVEIASRGLAPSHARYPRREYIDALHGRQYRFLRFYPAQVGAVFDLARACCHILDVPYRFPVEADGSVIRGVLPAETLAEWTGLVGHFHITDRKVDPSPHLLDDLSARASLRA